MTAPATPESTTATPETGTATPPTDNGDGSKTAVLADLARERDRRQAAEAKVADFDRLQAELQKFRDVGKTAEQLAADQLASLTRERDAATASALRYDVCAEQDLPLKAARFLTGTTKAEIEASAKALKELGTFGPAGQPGTGLPGNPNGGQQPPAKSKGVSAGRDMFKATKPAPAST